MIHDDQTPDFPCHADAMREVAESQRACMTDGCAVLRSVALCLEHKLEAPQWLIDAYLTRHAVVTEAFALDWSVPESFGAYWPARTRLDAARKHIRLKRLIHGIVWRRILTDPSSSIGRIMFDEIGEMEGVHVSGAHAERLYYESLSDGRPNPIDQRRGCSGLATASILSEHAKAEDEFSEAISIVKPCAIASHPKERNLI